MIHRVKLSNGQVLLIEEDKESLHIASEEDNPEHGVAMYVCTITSNGVTVMPNSGGATHYLTCGLNKLSV